MAHHVVCRSLTPAAVQKLRNAFSEMDMDASGSVSLPEFQEVYARLSLKVTRDNWMPSCKPISLECRRPYCIRKTQSIYNVIYELCII